MLKILNGGMMMKGNYGIISLLVLAVCILIWELGSHTEIKEEFQPEGQLIFKMAEHRTKEYPTNEGAYLFAKLVEERTDGQVKILIYDGYELGDEASIIEQVAFGGIDFARISGVYLDEYLDEMSAICLPGLYENNQEMMAVFNNEEIGTKISEDLKNEKINILTWFPGSTRGVFYDTPELIPYSKSKIAVPTSSMKILEVESLGFQPVPTMQDNVNSYLSGEYVSGAEGELLDYYYGKSYNKARNFTKTESRIPEAIVASNSAFKQLTVDQQMIVTQAAVEAGISTYTMIIDQEEKVEEELLSLGYNIDYMDMNAASHEGMVQLENAIGHEDLLKRIRSIID